MQQVILTGWKPGMRKVELTKLLQARAHLSLAAAHDSVNRCLMGEAVRVDVPTAADAESLAHEVEQLGAIAEVHRVEQR